MISTGLLIEYETVKTTWNSLNLTIPSLNWVFYLEYTLLHGFFNDKVKT